MQFSCKYEKLPEYTFDRLRGLLGDISPGGDRVIDMSIGEPRHEFPHFIAEEIQKSLQQFGKYPPKDGIEELFHSIANWIQFKFDLPIDPRQNLVLTNGSKEGLFNACIAFCPNSLGAKKSKVVIPNPFYQVYAGAAIAANGDPWFVSATEENNHFPDFHNVSSSELDQVSIVYLCSPSNPQGSIAGLDYIKDLMELSRKHDFIVFSDECYSEIYRNQPPPSLLHTVTDHPENFDRMLVFNSLSKRSNLPGIRSGFVAGGAKIVSHLKKYRSYSDPGVSIPLQKASARVWADETHVETSRVRYQKKYQLCDRFLSSLEGYHAPQGGIFLWIRVPDGEKATLKLWSERGIKVVPGAYFSKEVDGFNPGEGFIRAAIVANETELEVGLKGLKDALQYGKDLYDDI